MQTGAEEVSAILSPQALAEIAQVEAEIDRIEAQTIERLAVPPDNQGQQIELLGKLMLYDKQLLVNRNEACAFCHMPETGFTGSAPGRDRRPPATRCRFISTRSIAAGPARPSIRWRNPSPATRPLPR